MQGNEDKETRCASSECVAGFFSFVDVISIVCFEMRWIVKVNILSGELLNVTKNYKKAPFMEFMCGCMIKEIVKIVKNENVYFAPKVRSRLELILVKEENRTIPSFGD